MIDDIFYQGWFDSQTLVNIMAFNIYNPSINVLQSFKLIFQFTPSGLITVDYDNFLVSLKLYATNFQTILSILIYIIGFILLVISIIDMRRQHKQKQSEILLEQEQSKKLQQGLEPIPSSEVKPKQESNEKELKAGIIKVKSL